MAAKEAAEDAAKEEAKAKAVQAATGEGGDEESGGPSAEEQAKQKAEEAKQTAAAARGGPAQAAQAMKKAMVTVKAGVKMAKNIKQEVSSLFADQEGGSGISLKDMIDELDQRYPPGKCSFQEATWSVAVCVSTGGGG